MLLFITMLGGLLLMMGHHSRAESAAMGDTGWSWLKATGNKDSTLLRDIDNGMDQVPSIRLEIRKGFYQQSARSEQSWPPASVKPVLLYLCANSGILQNEPVASEGKVQYQSTSRKERAVFLYRFEQATELIGSMRLRLWVSTSEGDDLDPFVVLRKLDSAGKEIFFSGFNGYEHGVAKGWLRASHGDLDPSRGTPLRPWHSHARTQKLRSATLCQSKSRFGCAMLLLAPLFPNNRALRVILSQLILPVGEFPNLTLCMHWAD